jgi:hypothetical protein
VPTVFSLVHGRKLGHQAAAATPSSH